MTRHQTEPAPGQRFHRWTVGALSILLTSAAAWLWAHEGHAPLPTRGAQVDVAKGQVVLSPEARNGLDVQTAEVQLLPVEEKILAYATLVAPWQRHAFATSRLPGRIHRLYIQPGQSVSAGQVLAEVQSLELETLQLELVNAQNDVELSAKILTSLEGSAGAIPEQRIWEARTRYKENVNALDVARGKWLSLGLSGEDLDQLLRQRNPRLVRALPVRSAVGGIVIHADLAVGKVIEPTEHLFEIIDLSTVWVKVGVVEKDLYRVAVGQPVELRLAAYPGETLHAKIQVRGLYLDAQTHLGSAWAELTNPAGQEPRFLPGMYGQAHIVIPGPRKMTAVPAAAVLGEGPERYVLIEAAATAAASEYLKRNVVVRLQAQDVSYVEGGIFPGERVVTRGGHELASFFVQGVLRLSDEARQSIGLRVEPAQAQGVEDVVEVDGVVDVPPDRRTSVSSQLAGTLQRILVDRGQPVRAGEVIAEVASLDLQNLQLDLLRSHLQSQLLEESLGRLRSSAGALPQRLLWETESAYNAARNQRDSLRQKLATVGLSRAQLDTLLTEKKLVEALPLRAAIAGTVVHFDKVLGQAVRAEEPLFAIHDLSRAWVQGFLSEPDLTRLRLDLQKPPPARVRLVAEPNRVLHGKVLRSGRVFDAEHRNLSVWVELDEPAPAGLQHNMLARLSLPVYRPAPTLALPRPAVVREGTRAYVFVQKPDGLFERRTVHTGRADDRFVEITGGLQAGEPVVVQGAPELQTAYAVVR